MQNAIIYSRVSTDEQADKGFSLANQKNVLEIYCKHKNINILKTYREDYSAKTFDRPEFNKIMEYIKINRKSIDFLLFTKWDRFSRNIEESYRIIRKLRGLGIEVNAIEQPLDLSQPDSKILLAIYLVTPEVENDKISLRTIEGMRRAMKEGYFTGVAPFGYKNFRNKDGKSTLKPIEESAIVIRNAFKDYAKGLLSSEEVRKKYYNKGLKISKQSFLNMLRNHTYCGRIAIKPWKKEDLMIVNGVHEAIIDDQTFNLVQKRLQNKQNLKIHKFSEIDKMLPLRGYLLTRR